MGRNIPSNKLDLTSKEREQILEFVHEFGPEFHKLDMKKKLESMLHKVRRSTKYQIKKSIK